MTDHLRVRDGGLSTTVQDLGRPGYQSLGLPPSGALDPVSLRLANALVGNDRGEAALELRWLGPVLEVQADAVRVALAGTEVPIEILGPEPRSVPAAQSVLLRRGEVFRIHRITDTSCCYLAVAGGLAVPAPFGSRSTYLRGGIGGLEGRALASGDSLALTDGAAPSGPERRLAKRPAAGDAATGDAATGDDGRVRVVLGPQADHFTDAGLESFFTGRYEVTRATDRMGVRLSGPPIAHSRGYDIPSDGIVSGAIQVPGTGQPIVLLADRQTTGGYPKIACVISADLPRLGRMGPGESLSFEAVSAREAEAIRRAREQAFLECLDAIEPVGSAAASLAEALLTENLISGGEWAAGAPHPGDDQ